MALWLPQLSIDRLRRLGRTPPEDRPFALYAKVRGAYVLNTVNSAARKAHVMVGQALADARAICPGLTAQEAEPEADARILDETAAWCDRFTPVVVVDAPDGLFLDVTGCTHLFGGEDALLRGAVSRLRQQGFIARAAIAPNPGAAWALAHFGERIAIGEDDLAKTLGPLPLQALRLQPDALALLRRLGIKRVAQILDAPRAAFTARAGQDALLRLDQAMGRTPEALTPRRPPPMLYAMRRLAEPILTLDAVLTVIGDMSEELCAKLEEAGYGARLLRLFLFGVDSKVRSCNMALSRPEQNAKVILRLFRERLSADPESLNAQFGFEMLRLEAAYTTPIRFHATDLAPASKRDRDSEIRALDTITARLGPAAVAYVQAADTHAPQRATRFTKTGSKGAAPAPPEDNVMRRPLCVFAKGQPIEALATVPDGPPLRFRWRRVLHEIVRAEGPERIAPDWLRQETQARDYYRVEDKNGQRFWLYREGLYGEDGMPRWFIQGAFA